MPVIKTADGTPLSVMSIDAVAMGGYKYSENEVIVGCWTDGRPIYRRSFLNLISNNEINTSSTPHMKEFPDVDHKKLGIDTLVDVTGMLISDSGGKVPMNSGYSEVGGYWTAHFVASGPLREQHNIARFNNCSFDITLLYTKTTDAANSFKMEMLFENKDLLTALAGDIATEVTANDVKGVFS